MLRPFPVLRYNEKKGVTAVDTLESLRAEIRRTDEEMRELFVRRCRLAARIGAYKARRGLPVEDKAHEADNRQVLAAAVDLRWREYYMSFLQTVMELAKRVQRNE